MIDSAVSAAAGGACAGTAGLLYFAERLPGISRFTTKLQTDRAQAILLMVASVGLVSTPMGSWLNQTVNDLNSWANGLIGQYTGLVITGFLALAVFLWWLNDVIARTVTVRTLVLAVITPILAVSIPGTVGTVVQTPLGWIAGLVGSLVGGLFGVA